MGLDGAMIYRFADCELDMSRHRLLRGGDEVHVEPQVFALLALLIERDGDVVTRDEMIERVWKGQIVSEATVGARISAARAAIGDTGRAQAVIRTVPRVGLQLVVPVEVKGQEERAAASGVPAQGLLRIRSAQASDGSHLAWTASGEGPPLLRAGHWLTNLDRDRDNAIWGPWLARLGRGRRLVRYDSRGTGMSSPDCGALTLESFVDDLATVADAAGLERFDIFAASQSVAVSLAYALRHPARVRRIVSYGGWPQGASMRKETAGASMTEALGAMLRLGWGKAEGGYMRSFISLFLPGASPEQVAAFVELQTASATPERAVEIRDVISRFDVMDILPKVQVPVLVAHARDDAMHPFSQAQLLMQYLPDAQLLPLPSANHILLPDEPAFNMLMDAVDRFLAE